MAVSDRARRALLVANPSDLVRVAVCDLGDAGLAVTIAKRGTEALAALSATEPDVVVIGPTEETNTVFANYCEIRRALRARRSVTPPIVILVEPDDQDEAITTLETGIDDFLVLPLKPRVLASWIQLTFGDDETDLRLGRIRYANLTIDMRRHIVFCGRREAVVSPTGFAILVLLTTDPGRVYSRQDIISGIHGHDRQVGERVVDTQIRSLRRALGECGALLETVRSVGYRIRPG